MIIPEKWFNIDIEPYVYKDEYCTIDFNKIRNYKFKDWPCVWITESINPDIANLIDKRLKKVVMLTLVCLKLIKKVQVKENNFGKG